MRTIIYLATLLLLLQACTAEPRLTAPAIPSLSGEEVALLQRGQQLMESNCVNCHPQQEQPVMMGPTMALLQEKYREKYTELADFSPALQRFLQQPDPSYALLAEAITQYGLMPKLEYSEQDIAAVSKYLYYADLTKKNWLQAQFSTQLDSLAAATSVVDYVAQGRDYAMRTKSVLGSQLLSALGQGGPLQAVSFCQVQALPLTDSMSVLQTASIRRLSDRPRNPANQADSAALAAITQIQHDLAAGNKDAYQLREQADSITAYYPILTNEMCLQCHGQKGQTLQAATHAAILDHYPADKAIGYAANELRGVWVVKWAK